MKKQKHKPITIDRKPAQREAGELAAVHDELRKGESDRFAVAIGGLFLLIGLAAIGIWWVLLL